MSIKDKFMNLGGTIWKQAKRAAYLSTAATVGFLTMKTASKVIPGNKDNELLEKAEEEAGLT